MKTAFLIIIFFLPGLFSSPQESRLKNKEVLPVVESLKKLNDGLEELNHLLNEREEQI